MRPATRVLSLSQRLRLQSYTFNSRFSAQPFYAECSKRCIGQSQRRSLSSAERTVEARMDSITMGTHDVLNQLPNKPKDTRNAELFCQMSGAEYTSSLARAVEFACEHSERRYKWGDRLAGPDAPIKYTGILTLQGSMQRTFFSQLREGYSPNRGIDKPEPILSIFHQEQRGSYQIPFPSIKMKNGTWRVVPPFGKKRDLSRGRSFAKLGDAFDLQARIANKEDIVYRLFIEETIRRMVEKEGRRFGAVVIDPIVLGDTTKTFVDPLFQHILVKAVRENSHLFSPTSTLPTQEAGGWQGLPIIFNEARGSDHQLCTLDVESLLQVKPDLHLSRVIKGDEYVRVQESSSGPGRFAETFASTAQPEDDTFVFRCRVKPTKPGQTLKLDVSKEVTDAVVDANKGWEHEFEGSLANIQGVFQCLWSNDFVRRISQSSKVRSAWAAGPVLGVELLFDRPGLKGISVEEANEFKNTLYKLAPRKRFRWNVTYDGAEMSFWLVEGSNTNDWRHVERVLAQALLGEDVLLEKEEDGLFAK